MKSFDLIIIGGGPAGLAAGIQAQHMGLNVVVLDKGSWGGRIRLARRVENLLGLPGGPNGQQVAEKIVAHAKGKGLAMITEFCELIDLVGESFIVSGALERYEAGSVIAAIGAQPKRLQIPDAPSDRDVVFYSWRDLPFIKGKRALVIGSGEVAFDQACNLAERGASVTVLVRGGAPRAFEGLVNEAVALGVEVWLTSTVRRIQARDDELLVEIDRDGSINRISTDYILVSIGAEPCEINVSASALDRAGRGFYWAGDVVCEERQASIAMGDGVKKAMIVYEYLREVR
jgi:thioredoxin reductase (NADPH)